MINIRSHTTQPTLLLLLFLLFSIAYFCSCTSESEVIVSNKPQKNTAKAAKIHASSAEGKAQAPTSAFSTPQGESTFTYSSVGKRDPFTSYIAKIKKQKDFKDRAIEATEQYELAQYSLVALVSETSIPRAMVEDPNQQGHILTIGSRLGKNGGRVTKITDSFIVVNEEFRAPTGELINVPITVQLPQEKEIQLQSFPNNGDINQ